jgi:hypothetical protein
MSADQWELLNETLFAPLVVPIHRRRYVLGMSYCSQSITATLLLCFLCISFSFLDKPSSLKTTTLLRRSIIIPRFGIRIWVPVVYQILSI